MIFRTRILYNNGSADAITGLFGKVYDRADDMRVLASIEGYGRATGYVASWLAPPPAGCRGATRWVPEAGVAASFAEHAHLADLPSLFDEDSFEPGGCDCQFTALLALALYTVRVADRNPRGGPSSTASALPLMRTMLRALANPGSAAHAENTVVQVLCSDGLPLETICTFACGRYPILVESDPPPNCLDWLLRDSLPLMQAIRHQRAGDSTKAMAAMEAMATEWDSNEDHLFVSHFDAWMEKYDGRQNADEYVDEYIAENEKLSLGLADNEAFWSWIARHSPLVRESNA